MTPEAEARQHIDHKLTQAGWVIQDRKQLNLGAAPGVAVREYPTDSGPTDYLLFVNRSAVGVIEAKKDEAGENLTATEPQTERYANATLKWRKDDAPLRLLLVAIGSYNAQRTLSSHVNPACAARTNSGRTRSADIPRERCEPR